MRSVFFTLATAVMSCILFSYASAQKITDDILPNTDFSKYKTYKWQRADKAIYPSEENDKMLMRAIDAELAAKGLTKVDTDTADAYVIYQLAIMDDMQWSSFKGDIGWYGGFTNSLPGFQGASTNTSTQIKSGSLILEVFDVAQKTRVWQAYAVKTVDPKAELQKREKNTRKVMAKVLKAYPSLSK
ncbi:MAG: DUF4136 domain-containing protein [Pyrinomonadaceae bacterium]